MNQEMSPANLLWNPAASPNLPAMCAHLALAAVLALLLAQAYIRFGQALSNRRLFARNFLLLTLTTTLIITIVKSSLALSLGLVGALSIVRFRAAIKEPEELAFLFLAISIGLGLGAGQALVTIVAFAIITGVLAVRHAFHRAADQSNLYLTVHTANPGSLSAQDVLRTVGESGGTASLKRLDESQEAFEASFLVSFRDVAQLEAFGRKLRDRCAGVKLSYVEERGLGV